MPEKTKMHIRGLAQASFLLGVLLLPLSVGAQGIQFPTGTEGVIADIITRIITGVNMLSWMFFILLNSLLNPRFIFDLDENGEGAFMEILNNVWQLSRDLMNLFFALVLVAAAIYVVVTQKKDEVVPYVRTFVMAVVLVNFSWFFPRVIIDVANVATSAIYGIPSLLEEGGKCEFISGKDEGQCEKIDGQNGKESFRCPCMVVVNADMIMSEQEYNDHLGQADDGWECMGNLLCIQKQPMEDDTISGHSAVLNGLIVNHARLKSLADVPVPPQGNSINQLLVFLVREMLILVIHLALFFPLMAMLVAFVIRIPVLWITIAFMPFVFLSMIGGGMFNEVREMIWKNFLRAAFLPAIVAIPLTIGFIMINAATQITAPAGLANIPIRLLDDVNDFWQLLWIAMSAGVMWIGVFSALSKVGGVLSKGSERIKEAGASIGRLAMKAPLAVPILPGIGMTPLAAMKQLGPRSVEAGISGPQGFRGYIDALKAGRGDGEAKANTAAKEIATDPVKMERLTDKIKELTDAIDKDQKARRDDIIKEIRTEHHEIDIDSQDPATALQDLLKRARKDPKVDTTKAADMETALTKLTDTIRKKNPPATPTTPANTSTTPPNTTTPPTT